MHRHLHGGDAVNELHVTCDELMRLAANTAVGIQNWWELAGEPMPENLRLYGVPRGGVYAALALLPYGPFELVEDPLSAHVIVDDIYDSGKTAGDYATRYPGKPFFTLIDKPHDPKYAGAFVVFPWERLNGEAGGIEDNIVRLLQYVGEDPARGGLLETPTRVAKAWQQWTSGYAQDPARILKVFEDGAERHDQMITVRDIPFYSHCEHHMAPIFGTASVAYIPNGKIVGLSKLSRLVDVYARRLQVQERLTDQIADALFEHLAPIGVGVLLRARHLCMESRGVCQQGHSTVTSALRGAIKNEPTARAEFFSLCGNAP